MKELEIIECNNPSSMKIMKKKYDGSTEEISYRDIPILDIDENRFYIFSEKAEKMVNDLLMLAH